MNAFRSPLASQLSRFLAHKRALGFAYLAEEGLLRRLDRIAADEARGATVDDGLVRRFVAAGARSTRSQRLTVVRQFARFIAVQAPGTFVPPHRFLGARRNRPVIRVLSRTEAGRFLDACDSLRGSPRYPHRGLVLGTALRTLLLTGLRRAELLSLTGEDVDLGSAAITVRRGKFGKSRFVPISRDLAERLRSYDDDLRKRIPSRLPGDAFFPGPDGRSPCRPKRLYLTFRKAIEDAGIAHGGRGDRPRLHDLRHSWAVFRLLTWYEQGADLGAKLPLLATYLGHIGLASTQVYLHMTLDLVGEVERRFEARFGHLITEEAVQ